MIRSQNLTVKCKALLSVMMALMLMITVAFSTACEQKTMEQWAENALSETAALIPLLDNAGNVIAFQGQLSAFIEHAKVAKTTKERATLIIEFSEVVATFQTSVAPLVPPESDVGRRLEKINANLKNIARKVSCLISRSRDSPDLQRQDFTDAANVIESYAEAKSR